MRLFELLLFAPLLFVVINASSPSFDDFPTKATEEEPSASSPAPRKTWKDVCYAVPLFHFTLY